MKLSDIVRAHDWDYEEREGDGTTRFDKGQASIWVEHNGEDVTEITKPLVVGMDKLDLSGFNEDGGSYYKGD